MLVFDAVAERLSTDGLATLEDLQAGRPGVSLFGAVRRVHGMHPDASVVAYWDWQSLSDHLVKVWEVLDGLVSIREGRPTQAVVWSSEAGRSLQEVLDLLAEANSSPPDLKVLMASPRPMSAQMVAPLKFRGALANTLGAIHQASGDEYVAIIPEVLADAAAVIDRSPRGPFADEDLLWIMDRIAGEFDASLRSADKSDIPRLLAQAIGEHSANHAEDKTPAFSFLKHLSENPVAMLDDDHLRQHLSRSVPSGVSA